MSKRSILTATVLLVACGAAILSAQPAGKEPGSRPVKGPWADGEGPPPVVLSPQQEAEFLGVL